MWTADDDTTGTDGSRPFFQHEFVSLPKGADARMRQSGMKLLREKHLGGTRAAMKDEGGAERVLKSGPMNVEDFAADAFRPHVGSS
ncbi:MAG TPA: hypothetical protein VHK90_09625, partial [Thermoanaerobaculia bacterium]|nr:hypothetical protein [Thermoanaerobaculia bacterium]